MIIFFNLFPGYNMWTTRPVNELLWGHNEPLFGLAQAITRRLNIIFRIKKILMRGCFKYVLSEFVIGTKYQFILTLFNNDPLPPLFFFTLIIVAWELDI